MRAPITSNPNIGPTRTVADVQREAAERETRRIERLDTERNRAPVRILCPSGWYWEPY